MPLLSWQSLIKNWHWLSVFSSSNKLIPFSFQNLILLWISSLSLNLLFWLGYCLPSYYIPSRSKPLSGLELSSLIFLLFWSFFFNLLPLPLPPSLPSVPPISLPFFLCFHQHSIHSLKFHFSYQTSLTLLTSADFLLSDHWIVLGTTYVVLFVSSRLFSCSSFYLWFRAVHMVIVQIDSYIADPILSCLLYSSLVTMWPVPEILHSANWR